MARTLHCLGAMRIDKILVPTDLGPASETALAYAVDLAAGIGREVVVAHVLGVPFTPFLDGAIISSAQAIAAQITVAERQIEALRDQHARSGVSVTTRVVQGAPVEEILRLALVESCDLIVMGTHGRTGLRRLALGSVAEQVVRRARVPVLTVRGEPEASLMDALAAQTV